jgi:molecular chaperone HtpG
VEVGEGDFDPILDLEVRELVSLDGGKAAIAWILHHGYTGAIPTRALVKGIRFRVGNMQVGDSNLVEELFPEPRFNGWTIGEVHVLDPKVIPNGRRDNFEQSVHFDNLMSQLTPQAREAARRCRQSSIARKWIREFELQKAAALASAKAYARGGLSQAARRTHADAVAKSLKAIQKIVATRHIGDDIRAELSSQARALEARVTKLLGAPAVEKDPLERFKPQVRSAYQDVISLIYEFASNSAAAGTLVDKILGRLGTNSQPRQRTTNKQTKVANASKISRRRRTAPRARQSRH